MRNAPLLNLVLGVVLAIALGWLLMIGQHILLPILAAVITVYIIVTASGALASLPGMRRLPIAVPRFAVLLLFTLVVVVIAIVVASTAREIAAVAPRYETNLEGLLDRSAALFDLDTQDLLNEIRAVTIDQIDIRKLAVALLGGFTSVGSSIFLVIVYAAFLLSEREGFHGKIRAAFRDEAQAARVSAVIGDMNRKIGDYLFVKTLINLIVGVLSFGVLWAMGVDFALFWAITIGLLNYIPYVGSYIAVAMPVLLSLAQFASISTTLVLTVLLVAVQMFVGNYLEPRIIGQQLNLSPFVVIVSLIFWASLWGVPGAILAIPMTSVIVIALSSFPSTRFLAVLLANRVEDENALIQSDSV